MNPNRHMLKGLKGMLTSRKKNSNVEIALLKLSMLILMDLNKALVLAIFPII